MIENRIHQFDHIRVVRLIGIVICYFLLESANYGWLGRHFAWVFNYLV